MAVRAKEPGSAERSRTIQDFLKLRISSQQHITGHAEHACATGKKYSGQLILRRPFNVKLGILDPRRLHLLRHPSTLRNRCSRRVSGSVSAETSQFVEQSAAVCARGIDIQGW